MEVWINDNLAAKEGWRNGGKERWIDGRVISLLPWRDGECGGMGGVEGWRDRGTFLQWRGYGWIDGEM